MDQKERNKIAMKSGIAYAIILAGIFSLVMCMSGCKGKQEKPVTLLDSDSVAVEEPKPDTLVVDSMGYSDSTKVADVMISFDYPRGDSPLAENIKSMLNRELFNNRIPVYDAEYNQVKEKAFTTNLDGKVMLETYGKRFMKRLLDESKASEAPIMEDAKYYHQLQIKKSNETEKYITYSISDDCYLMGAHGSFTAYDVQFDKTTGKEITQIVDTTKVKQMQSLLIDGIYSYFKGNDDEIQTKSDIWNVLILQQEHFIPLPAHQPVLTPKGLAFTYQQYEIAPYACGLPCFTIPYDKIRKYLTPEVQKLIE